MLRQEISPAQQTSRAKNVVAQFLFSTLIVPKIFFDARWPARKRAIDVLAVDRSGAGEIHVAQVRIGPDEMTETAEYLMTVPAHFKYVAVFPSGGFIPSRELLYAPDGMGRIGVILVEENGSADLSAHFLVRPERFRLSASYFKEIDRFTAKRPADIEIRP